jgi:hypothetical protein
MSHDWIDGRQQVSIAKTRSPAICVELSLPDPPPPADRTSARPPQAENPNQDPAVQQADVTGIPFDERPHAEHSVVSRPQQMSTDTEDRE